jgi:Gpi18-like mannosyltransferase
MLDTRTILLRLVFSILFLIILIILYAQEKKISRLIAIPIITVSFLLSIQYAIMIAQKTKHDGAQHGLYFKKSKKYDRIGGLPSGVGWL